MIRWHLLALADFIEWWWGGMYNASVSHFAYPRPWVHRLRTRFGCSGPRRLRLEEIERRRRPAIRARYSQP